MNVRVLQTYPQPPRVLLVSGPTASGKSGLAVYLALRLGGEVINIDSVQVYRGARIGAATISESEMQGVPHHLLGFLDPGEPWDVRRMAELVGATAAQIRSRGNVPILVGGGGMYVSALFSGISVLPSADPTVRRKLELREDASLYRELVERDPARAAQLHPNDRLRVIRALETIERGGASVAELHGENLPPWVVGLMIVLTPPREALYRAINARVEQMVLDGLEREVAALMQSAPADAVLWRAIGYSHARKLREGGLSFEQFQSDIQRDTRRFAKRQSTFWRNEPRKREWQECAVPADWTWLLDRGTIEELCGKESICVVRAPLMGAELVSVLADAGV